MWISLPRLTFTLNNHYFRNCKLRYFGDAFVPHERESLSLSFSLSLSLSPLSRSLSPSLSPPLSPPLSSLSDDDDGVEILLTFPLFLLYPLNHGTNSKGLFQRRVGMKLPEVENALYC